MRNGVSVLLMSTAVAVAGTCGAQGPMSSGKPPETAAASTPAGAAEKGEAFDVQKLFANTCGWCHSDAGRSAGKGPKLMGTTLSDAEIIHRIKVGKVGAMPAFGSNFTDDQLQAIVHYIRSLHE